MKIYNYQYWSNQTNATITISVRTGKGREIADIIAEDELVLALRAEPTSWWVDEVSEEAY